jgi:hypothetical protein
MFMIEVVAVIVVLYALSVVLSWGMIKLVFDEVPPPYALIPIFNLFAVVIGFGRGRPRRKTGRLVEMTPEQELDRERYRHWVK